jgi:rubrerythrin
MTIKNIDPFAILETPAENPHDIEPTEETESDLVGDLNKRIDDFKRYSNQHERTWEYLNMYHMGEQFIARSKMSNDVLRVIMDEDVRKRYSQDNIMFIAARAFVGKMTRTVAPFPVIPRTNDRDDEKAAEVMDSFKDYFDRKEQMHVKYKRAIELIPSFGTAIFQPVWDNLGGRKIYQCPKCGFKTFDRKMENQPCPICKEQTEYQQVQPLENGVEIEQGFEAPLLKQAYEGDVVARLHNPRDFMFDLGASEPEDMQWACVSRVLHIKQIREMFPDKWNMIQKEDNLVSDRFLQYSASLQSSQLQMQYLEDHARLYEFHEMPTGKYENGRLIYMCSDRIVYEGPNPYVEILGRLPFYILRGERKIGEMLGVPLGIQAEPLQREYNKLVTQIREHRELVNNPQILLPVNCGLSKDVLDTTPGRIYKLNMMAGQPMWRQQQPLQNSMLSETQRLKGAILEKYGVTPYEIGGAGESGESGRYAAFLETQSAAAVTSMFIEINSQMKEFYRAVLSIAQRYMPKDRTWTIVGRDRMFTFSWSKANILPGWDIAIGDDDILSRNPALRLQQVAQMLLPTGIFADEQTGQLNKKMFMRTLGLRLPGIGPDSVGTEYAYAAELPELIEKAIYSQQQVPEIQPFDDVRILAEELQGWLRANRKGDTPQSVIDAVMKMYIVACQGIQAAPTPLDAKVLPNALYAQQGQPNANPNVPQQGQSQAPQPGAGMPTAMQGSTASETQQSIQATDQQAEQTARMSEQHEGGPVK